LSETDLRNALNLFVQYVSQHLRRCAGYSQPFGPRSFTADDRNRRFRNADFFRDQPNQFRISCSVNLR
jgi:hypothetical protein